MIKTLKFSDMHKYQHRMVDWILSNQSCALWAEPGLGKTVAALTATKQLKHDFEVDRTLVIAPLRVSRSVWPKEIHRWEHLQDMTCENLYWPDAPENKYVQDLISAEGLRAHDRDSDEERVRKLKRRDTIMYNQYIPWLKEKLSRQADIYTINKEQVSLLCRILYLKWGFDHVIIDESSAFKRQESQRWQALRAIRSKIHRLVELTGTPASNGLMNIWSQIWLLDQGESLYKNITGFRNAYYQKSFDGHGWDLVEGAKDKIYKSVEHLCLTMLEEDYLEVPRLLEVPVPLTLPPRAQKMYDELEQEFLVQFDEETVTAVHKAALHNKLRQICNGAVYVDDTFENPESERSVKSLANKKKKWKHIHDVKIDALRNIYEEAEGEPILVAYNFKHDLERIQKAFPEARLINTDQDVDDWNAGKIPMGLGHPASMGHGLNIQFGGHILALFGYTWDLELYIQWYKRLKRQGQEFPVILHCIYIDLPTEKVMRDSLKENQLTQKELMDRMKKETLTNRQH